MAPRNPLTFEPNPKITDDRLRELSGEAYTRGVNLPAGKRAFFVDILAVIAELTYVRDRRRIARANRAREDALRAQLAKPPE